jgi:type II secretory pathway pseudopilin PulG
MAALLVAIAVITIMMSAAMPVWRHDQQREKEAELVWRGNQYVRAIRLFQAKTGTFPTSVDMLVQGRFLRKKYLDPITNGEFTYLGAASVAGQLGGGAAQLNPGATGQRGAAPASSNTGGLSQGGNGQTSAFSTPATASSVPGGLIGVQSKSKDESILIFNGRSHYNEWVFLFAGQPGGRGGVLGGPGRGTLGGPQNAPGGRNGRGGNNGQRGRGFRGGPGGNPFPFPPPGGPGRGPGGGL